MEDFLRQVGQKAKDCPELMEVFVNCYTNTLQTTVREMGDGTVHVITGDIPAMWLRDSAAQVRPYLFCARGNEKIREMIAGVVRRQFRYICIDAYANAFNEQPNGACWEKDDPEQSPWVWERKFEVDLCAIPCSLPICSGKIRGVCPSLTGISLRA